ncbi:hypothetical protein I5M74_24625 [Serratia marcescens]|nr:hypothetical protein [Serratia marcescens]
MKRLPPLITAAILLAGNFNFAQAGAKGDNIGSVQMEYDVKASSNIELVPIPGELTPNAPGKVASLRIKNNGNQGIMLVLSSRSMNSAGELAMHSSTSEDQLNGFFSTTHFARLPYNPGAEGVVADGIEANSTTDFILRTSAGEDVSPGLYTASVDVHVYRP